MLKLLEVSNSKRTFSVNFLPEYLPTWFDEKICFFVIRIFAKSKNYDIRSAIYIWTWQKKKKSQLYNNVPNDIVLPWWQTSIKTLVDFLQLAGALYL